MKELRPAVDGVFTIPIFRKYRFVINLACAWMDEDFHKFNGIPRIPPSLAAVVRDRAYPGESILHRD